MTACGCAILGPGSIKYSRAAYNDVIVATNSQQVLEMMVRMRYGEPTGLLAVSTVTANLHIQGTIGSEFGIGSDSSYEGNLTPLSAGVAYEENPTISYAPVQGEKYLRQMLSPLPVDLTVLLVGGLGSNPQTITFLCSNINGFRNPAFLDEASEGTDVRFARIVELLGELDRAGNMAWMQTGMTPPTFALTLSGESDAYRRRVRELYQVLGFPPPDPLDDVVTLPVRLGVGKPDEPSLRLRTRSLWELFNVAAASVDVPDEYLESGRAPRLPPMGAVAKSIRIRRTRWHPRGAMVAVEDQGWWYFIDASDTASKLTFRMLEALMSVRMAEAAERKAAPVLTVPVAR